VARNALRSSAFHSKPAKSKVPSQRLSSSASELLIDRALQARKVGIELPRHAAVSVVTLVKHRGSGISRHVGYPAQERKLNRPELRVFRQDVALGAVRVRLCAGGNGHGVPAFRCCTRAKLAQASLLLGEHRNLVRGEVPLRRGLPELLAPDAHPVRFVLARFQASHREGLSLETANKFAGRMLVQTFHVDAMVVHGDKVCVN